MSARLARSLRSALAAASASLSLALGLAGCGDPPPPPSPVVPALAAAPVAAAPVVVDPPVVDSPAVDSPVVDSPAGDPWIDVALAGQVEWVDFRSAATVLIARGELGSPLGLAEHDATSGRLIAAIEGPPESGGPAAWSAAAGLLAFTAETGVVLRDLGGGAADRVLPAPSPEGLGFSAAGDRLAVAHAEPGAPASVEIFATASGKRLARETPLGRAKLDYDSGFRLVPVFFGAGEGERLALLLANDTPSEATLAVQGSGKAAKFRRLPLLEADDAPFGVAPSLGAALAVRGDGTLIAAGNLDARVHLFGVGADAPARTIAVGEAIVTAIAFAPDGAWLVAAGEDGPMTVLSIPDGAQLAQLAALPGCRSLAVSPDGRRVAGGGDGGLRIWAVTWGASR